ncbi:MAG: chalcone isomerase family protein [Paucibacter sp.]|nr:chalcone isomerase family protein [Roseateles sp.]
MRAPLLALLLAASLPGVNARADVDIGGIRYASTVKLDGQALPLNGVGTQFNKVGSRSFSVAVYALAKSGSASELLAMPGPKRIVFKFMRPVQADAMRFLTKGIEANLERADSIKTINGVVRLGSLLGGRAGFSDGDSLALDYLPGKGTVLAINGKPQGEPVAEPEFFKAMLLVWVGVKPFDPKMKTGILGG